MLQSVRVGGDDLVVSVSKSEFRDAMACVCASVNIVTTDGTAGRGGFTATAMSSVSDEPPLLLVCMKRSSAQSQLFVENGCFCVNVLTGQQTELAGYFAGGLKDMEARYTAAAWTQLVTGSPVLNHALINFDCKLDAVHVAGTHNIMIGRVVAVQQQPEMSALVYFERAYLELTKGKPARVLPR